MNRSRRIKLQIFRATVFLVLGAFFLVPIGAIVASLELAAITSVAMLVLLLPTMVWVRLRLPGLNRIVEFLCLLPLTIPAIALVVGLYPISRWMKVNLHQAIQMLSVFYLILVLPYSYRALDAGQIGRAQ